MGFRVHEEVHIIDGRMPRSSVNEAIVGVAAAQRYQGVGIGDTIQFSNFQWTVVGVFSANDTAFESEIWLALGDPFSDNTRRGCSSVRLIVAPGTDQDAIIRRIAEDPRISLFAQSEAAYYEEQAAGAKMLYLLTATLALIMGIGAVFGAMNTMYAIVAARTREIGTLRALGFSRGAILLSFVLESSLLALVGGVAGCLLASVVQGQATGASNLQSLSEVAFAFRVTPGIVSAGLVFALVMGVLGGLLPALRAARLPIATAVRVG
jgi:ABC-type lipoprotein release transport system permease subunit